MVRAPGRRMTTGRPPSPLIPFQPPGRTAAANGAPLTVLISATDVHDSQLMIPGPARRPGR